MKNRFRIATFLGLGVFFFWGVPSSQAALVINEFLADIPLGLAGDANRDGTRSASDDEFVELMNFGALPQDLSLWSLWDAISVRHVFSAGSLLRPFERWVIFGGGNIQGIPGKAAIASTGGLSLNNTAETIRLKDALGNIMDQVIYGREANRDQALTRFPEGSGPFQLHSEISAAGLSFSPGTDPEGRAATAVPEPSVALLISGGLAAMAWFKRRAMIPSAEKLLPAEFPDKAR